jgi:glycerol-3-phosphate dehydrogenase
MKRAEMLRRVAQRTKPWDMVVIGGGATGVGIAVDASSRGYDVLLLERSDFGKGTSSRSTKLLHGGVRYLQQGNVPLVLEALKERGLLLQNAPHLVEKLGFVIPAYQWWELPFYGAGLKLYRLLAGTRSFGPSEILTRAETRDRVPNVRSGGLHGGVLYYDGQFDDSRLLLSLTRTAADHGATVVNYSEVTELTHNSGGAIKGVTARDLESGDTFHVEAEAVVNATGPFCDAVRRLDRPDAAPMISPSQGIHLVVDGSFLAGKSAMLVPRTTDGRVMFAIPWHGHTLLGTTDTPIACTQEDPVALESEIGFVLANAARYLERAPQREDVLSVFAGIRPLVRADHAGNTAALSRDHTIEVSKSGLITITGGKWTTYRRMAADCVSRAAGIAGLPARACVTEAMKLHGFHESAEALGSLRLYGSDAAAIAAISKEDERLGRLLHRELPFIGAEVIWAVRMEMARTLEDVLARRLRALFLNSSAALEMAPEVARMMASELEWDAGRIESEVAHFRQLARSYRLPG